MLLRLLAAIFLLRNLIFPETNNGHCQVSVMTYFRLLQSFLPQQHLPPVFFTITATARLAALLELNDKRNRVGPTYEMF